MPWGTDKRMMELFDLADRKGFDVVKSTMKNHVRLIGRQLPKRVEEATVRLRNSANLSDSATIVNVGLALPLVGNTEGPAM
jgi:hypothetical protein